MVGGDAEILSRAEPAFAAMGAATHHAGGHGAGAALKLAVNALFGSQLAQMAELIGFLERSGVDAARAVEILGQTPVCSPAAKLSAEAMLREAFAPAFPIDLVAKDFGLVAASAEAAQTPTPVSDASGAVYERAAAAGFGGDNITGVAQLYRGSAASTNRAQ